MCIDQPASCGLEARFRPQSRCVPTTRALLSVHLDGENDILRIARKSSGTTPPKLTFEKKLGKGVENGDAAGSRS
jgi:hypothetical protein